MTPSIRSRSHLTKCFIAMIAFYTLGLSQGKELARPITLSTETLTEFEDLPLQKKKLITTALAATKAHGWLRYQFGSAAPKNKGFDCSGAMNYVFSSLKYEIPRTSSDQYLWLLKNDSFTKVGAEVTSLDHPVFQKLKPGDLVFWSGTYEPIDGRKTKITHVGMYLGTEKKDGRHVMVCSSKGRSYRGTAADGYGIFDFRLPRPGSKAKLIGFGTAPAPAK